MNPILMLMETDSFDAFAEDVANAYFTNPTHVRSLLNGDCIEQCVDYIMNSQTVELDLDDLPENQDGWTKPSRKNRRKHDKKEHKRKGSSKRFRDRSRKWASWRHMEKVYNRGLVGDWGVRGRRLEEIGAVSTANSHKIVRDIIPTNVVDDKDETRSFKYEDGTTISCTMSQNSWIAPIWDKDSTSYTSVSDEWKTAEFKSMLEENPRKWRTQNDDEYDPWEDDYDFDDGDDDEIIDEPAPTLNKSSYDTSEFTALEMAQMSMKLACATPDQRAWIREFMKTL